ncbi:MAG: hypothetical protein UZ17_ACD001000852 [Acidobacteria bacterium OLB17]|nr:MAG: hypothetical protein UZ17_ACD001000852 [Acidobacteria bacterium OLB17]MCZ2389974.1 hypothetical protein [Acidobacteriota bacterium]
MTWIYTILFSGLLFSTQPAIAEHQVPNGPAIVSEAQNGDITERLERSYPLSSNGRVSISNVNGRIELESWDKDEASLVVEKSGPSKEVLDSVKVVIESDKDRFSLKTEWREWESGQEWSSKRNVQVVIKMKLPRGAVLDEIESVNGDISIANFDNFVRASCVNGNINIARVRGRTQASTVNGAIDASFDQVGSGSEIELSTVNGPVRANIPTDSDVTLKAETLHGGITTEFGLNVKKHDFIGRSLHSKLGSGTGRLELESVNGPLSITHPKDGRSPNPVTDLLSGDRPDDEGRSSTIRSRVDKARISAETEKAIADAQLRSSTAMKAALDAAKKETEKALAINGSIVDKSVKEALEAAREQIKSVDIEKAVAKEARRAIRAVSRRTAFLNAFGNERTFGADSAVTRHSKSFAVTGTPNVTIEAPNCSVRVVGTDESKVRYSITEIRSADGDPPVDVADVANERSVEIRVNGTPRESWQTRLVVFVPRKSNLKITTDGEIRIDGVTGTLDLKGEDESITLYDSGGKLIAASETGRIRVVGFRGEVNAVTEFGTLSLDGDFDKLTALAGQGDILVTVPADFAGQIKAPEVPVRFDGIAASRVGNDEDLFIYEVGKGSRSFLLQSEGNIGVRSANSLLGKN